MSSVLITRNAQEQLRSIANDLDEKAHGHGSRLVEEFLLAVRLVGRFPMSGPVYYLEFRKILIKKYSCLVLYRIVDGQVVVVKVSDARREPEVIQGELDAT